MTASVASVCGGQSAAQEVCLRSATALLHEVPDSEDPAGVHNASTTVSKTVRIESQICGSARHSNLHELSAALAG